MNRKEFGKYISAAAIGTMLPLSPKNIGASLLSSPADARSYWVSLMQRLSDPVLEALSKDQLRATMPVEAREGHQKGRRKVTHLEAFGRLMAGLAPWLELGPATDQEGKLRSHYLDLSHQALRVAVDPNANDFMNFDGHPQALVDTAFLAHALLRAPTQLIDKLDDQTQERLVQAFKSSRKITPYYSNWLLFTGMVEAGLKKLTGHWDKVRVDYSVRKHLEWYVGDGTYGDGPEYHWDYYNSYVIQPMLLDVLKVGKKEDGQYDEWYQLCLKRARRYAEVQERLISPEGTFPPIGRSLAYRFGAFQLLAQIALTDELPESLSPGQVRSALTTVFKNMAEAEGTFNANGWLQIGFCGHQPGIGEAYISTGSLYLCSVGLLPLGLPADAPFWTDPAAPLDRPKSLERTSISHRSCFVIACI